MLYSEGIPSFVHLILYVVFIPRVLESLLFSGIARPTYLQSPFPLTQSPEGICRFFPTGDKGGYLEPPLPLVLMCD